MNKKKKGGADIYSDISNNGNKERMMKKRRYRSIDSLYTDTKPVKFLGGKQVF
ncbi:hypothetical protein OROGR_017337 [Orobanche gracilis]